MLCCDTRGDASLVLVQQASAGLPSPSSVQSLVKMSQVNLFSNPALGMFRADIQQDAARLEHEAVEPARLELAKWLSDT